MREMSSAAKTEADVLFAIAEGQQGYFTSKQAADEGYQLGNQAHHVKSGDWVRVERGIYHRRGDHHLLLARAEAVWFEQPGKHRNDGRSSDELALEITRWWEIANILISRSNPC